METVYLHGVEEVSRAARNMQSAAEHFERAVQNLQYSFEQHQSFFTQWLQEYKDIVETAASYEHAR